MTFSSNPEVQEPDFKYLSTTFDQVPDVDADPDNYVPLCWALEPGDCILHHPLTLHGAQGNASRTQRRRAVAMRFTGDDARYESRENNFVDALVGFGVLDEHGLTTGDKLGNGIFPRVWPRT